MYDYIKKQVTIDEINKALDRETLLNSFVRKIAVEAVKKMPSADVVEVVRCKDCKYWEETLNGKGYCKDIIGFGRWWKGNDYCSYGEREDG